MKRFCTAKGLVFAAFGVTIMLTLNAECQCVAFSRDGKHILMVQAGYADACLYNAKTYEPEQTFTSKDMMAIGSVAFSPDGRTALLCEEDVSILFHATPPKDPHIEIDVRDVTTGALLRTLTEPAAEISSAAFSPDGTKILARSRDHTAKLWDVTTGQEIQTFTHMGLWASVDFSPDGKKIVTGPFGPGDCPVTLWDVATDAKIRVFTGHTAHVYCVKFSPDGTKILSGSEDNTAKLWDAATGAVLQWVSHTERVHSVAFSPDGTKVLTQGGETTLWDAATGAVLRTFTTEEMFPIVHAVFTPDGTKVLTQSWCSPAKLLDATTGSLVATFKFEPRPGGLLPMPH